ncbi:MAG TPA: LuxR C-terminal-related transcriptional regulator [Acidimicrobiales bacterium]|nr:LuxR C-terminal-related transcriptional regulator [Acidimicrobiales bacterium]
MITAPAGYGKTVLVDQWAAEHMGPPVARMRLRPDDNWPRTAARVRTELASTGEAILVIDAADAITDERSADDLAAVVAQAPANVHLVLITRSRSVPVLSRLHGRTDVSFLTAADLAFTAAEARLLVGLVAGLDLGEQELERLLARTEGWAVGLRLGAIGLRDAPDPEAYVEEFAGDERHVAAYLFESVFAEQPEPVRRFLACTSMLDRLSGSLCDAVTGSHGGVTMLHDLERCGLFVRRLPGSREWFAYRRLFRDFLRSELRRGEYGAEAALLVRAGAWYAIRDDPDSAARYFIEAEGWNALLELTNAYGQRMFESDRASQVLHWLEAMPPAELGQSKVAVRRAFLHTMLGESRQAAQILHDLEAGDLSGGERIVVDVVRGTWAFFDATPESTIRAADDALRAMKEVDPAEIPNIFGMTSPTSVVMLAAVSRARAWWYLGDVDGARRTLSAGIKEREAYAPWLVHTRGALALLEAWAGNLRAARGHAIGASAVAGRSGLLQHPAMLDARLALAHVTRERGNQRRAAELLDEAETIAAGSRRPVTGAMLAVERARWHLAARQPEVGLEVLERYRAGGESPPPPLVEAHLRAAEAMLLLMLDDIDHAESVMTKVAASLCPDLAAARVQAAVARHDLEVANTRVESWLADDAQPRHRRERDLWAAVVAFEGGDRRTALRGVSRVVGAAEHEGDLRLFLDGGREVERLVRALLHSDPTPYAEHVVDCMQRTQGGSGGAVLGLSKRELEVARFLPTPLSSAEIAQRLYISLNTLKTHLRTIYCKLDATNRREAIRRAEELGIA